MVADNHADGYRDQTNGASPAEQPAATGARINNSRRICHGEIGSRLGPSDQGDKRYIRGDNPGVQIYRPLVARASHTMHTAKVRAQSGHSPGFSANVSAPQRRHSRPCGAT